MTDNYVELSVTVIPQLQGPTKESGDSIGGMLATGDSEIDLVPKVSPMSQYQSLTVMCYD